MPIEKFKQLHFLPDPVLKTKDSYKSFEEVYGEETTDKDQPSLKSEKHNHLADDKYKRDGLFVSAKVKGVMVCGECNKSRCIYASKKLSKEEEVALARIREDGNYDCGSPYSRKNIHSFKKPCWAFLTFSILPKDYFSKSEFAMLVPGSETKIYSDVKPYSTHKCFWRVSTKLLLAPQFFDFVLGQWLSFIGLLTFPLKAKAFALTLQNSPGF